MATIALYLGITFGAGLLAALVRVPPLVGFLAAGFILNAVGAPPVDVIGDLADFGVLLLLFGIGLQLEVPSLLRREVWAGAAIHIVVFAVVAAGFLSLLALVSVPIVAGTSFATFALLGFALSFSSTVFVMKVLEDRDATTSLYGRTAIGILVMQDLVAVVFLAIASGVTPNIGVFALALLALLVPLLKFAWGHVGHGVLQTLFAVAIALVPGYALFEVVGLKGELGALILGVLLARDERAPELAAAIFSLKDLLLVAFFVNIGLTGSFSLQALLVAGLLLILLPLKSFGFTAIFWACGFRSRNALLGGAALGQYSEFGLIVGSLGVSQGLLSSEWLTALSLAVALSLLAAALTDTRAESWAARWHLWEHEGTRLHPEERPITVGTARVLILGMGRVGRATYRRLIDGHQVAAIGVEHDDYRVKRLQSKGFEVLEADATDTDFWERVHTTGHLSAVVLALPTFSSNKRALERLRASGFDGSVTAVAVFDDDADALRGLGVDSVLQLYDGAGLELADQTAQHAG